MSSRASATIHRSVRAALAPRDGLVLAVSGGLDSMVLLDAVAATLPVERRTRVLVATFDHGTGRAASDAAALVEARSAALGVSCVRGRADRALTSEAALREARWAFLRQTAAQVGGGGTICTAHTEDDQIETVLMRVLRGAGARGLGALYVAGDVLRPLLRHRRSELVGYARANGVTWLDDPSNASRRYLRNRVRHDLLPALRRARPGIDRELLSTARRAARWRADLEAWIDEHIAARPSGSARGLDVPAADLAGHDAASLAILWPALAARVGLALDRRGASRLVAFTLPAPEGRSRVGRTIQLAGGWTVARSRDAFQLRASSSLRTPGTRRLSGAEQPIQPDGTTNGALVLSNEGATKWDGGGDGALAGSDARWTFRCVTTDIGCDAWSAWLPDDRPLSVRTWRPGDVMAWRPGSAPRKVKRFLSDAGITGHERTSWPVVLAGDQIVWIPGVRRSVALRALEAATVRSGRPGLAFVCEYIDRRSPTARSYGPPDRL